MDALKRIALILACICMLLIMYRLLKPEWASKKDQVAAATPVSQATPVPVVTPVATPVSTPEPTPAPTPELPVWDWALVQKETRVLPMGSALVGYDAPAGLLGKQKIMITATTPVTAAYIPSNYRDAMVSNPIETEKMNIFSCVQQKVLQATVDCPLPTDSSFTLVIMDQRTAGGMALSALALKFGLKKSAQQNLVRNDIEVQVYRWQCVRNCDVPQDQHGPQPG